jgi:hypothetical protein
LWQQQGISSRDGNSTTSAINLSKCAGSGDASTLQAAGRLCQGAVKVMDFARRSRQKRSDSIYAIIKEDYVRDFFFKSLRLRGR